MKTLLAMALLYVCLNTVFYLAQRTDEVAPARVGAPTAFEGAVRPLTVSEER